MSKMAKALGIHISIYDFSGSSKIRHLHQKCLPDNKSSLHIHMFLHPQLGFHLDHYVETLEKLGIYYRIMLVLLLFMHLLVVN